VSECARTCVYIHIPNNDLFCALAEIGETTDERYGIIFVGCCGLLGALAILPVVIFNTAKEKKGYSNLL